MVADELTDHLAALWRHAMTAHQATPSVPGSPSPAAMGRLTRRAGVAGMAVAILIAVGAYGTARIVGASPSASSVSPSAQAMQDLQDSVIGLYGPQPVSATGPPERAPECG
jgi:hypothetical protein